MIAGGPPGFRNASYRALASLDTGSAKDGDQAGFAGSAFNGENRHAASRRAIRPPSPYSL
jgi:hypothetical protein